MSNLLISNFIGYGAAVIMFNLFWLITDGIENYLAIYNGRYSKWFTVLSWLYTLSGIVLLIIGLLNLK